jgi:hypothetical protein
VGHSVHIFGIDPGATSGGYCLLDGGGAVLRRDVMPPMAFLVGLLSKLKNEADELHVILEKAQTMPKQGGVSVFRYGQHYGTLEGILLTLAIRHTVVHPSTWTKIMHSGCKVAVKGRIGAKERSYEAAKRIYPLETFLASDRSFKPHTGIIDAMLIAEWGRRHLRGQSV